MADAAEPMKTSDGTLAVPSRAEVTARLTGPGQPFEIEVVDVRGIPTRTWKTAPPTLRAVLELSASHGDADFLVRPHLVFEPPAHLGHSPCGRQGPDRALKVDEDGGV